MLHAVSLSDISKTRAVEQELETFRHPKKKIFFHRCGKRPDHCHQIPCKINAASLTIEQISVVTVLTGLRMFA
jgi:hypothetical protein